ncbi:unnamed protein product [Clonostachys byssicola]|uniref:BZIP domain-containing protein n=1 Tax=Clonostachys byssicola TaxID=160290 RepID=A0A9N9UNE0_9HYPO|nr:unnamed protein product [Clonostachys byssicola]
MSADEATQAKQRRKLQNRMNQRARRSRLKGDDDKPRRPFEVTRWRLDDEKAVSGVRSGRHTNPATRHDDAQKQKGWSLETCRVPPLSAQDAALLEREPLLKLALPYLAQKTSPLQDHLLHLIHFNVLRAVFRLKFILATSTAFCIGGNTPGIEPQLVTIDDAHPSRATLVLTAQDEANGLPLSVRPTTLQSSKDHATWIDIIPFPVMRDTLIRYEAEYDQVEFGNDLVGDLVDFANVYQLQRPKRPRLLANKASRSIDETGTVTSGTRTGMIVWGEPHCPENWEVTLGFMQKWPWALVGCQALVDSSNRWRALRGEEPLPQIDGQWVYL